MSRRPIAAAVLAATLSTGSAVAQESPAPCPDGSEECKPWERNWTDPDPWEKFNPQRNPQLGPGPHTLVIADGDTMKEFRYPSGAACQNARDEVRRQVAPPPSTRNIIYGPARVKAFCVPR